MEEPKSRTWIPAAILFAIGTGLQLSGFTNPYVAGLFFLSAVVMTAWWAWGWLNDRAWRLICAWAVTIGITVVIVQLQCEQRTDFDEVAWNETKLDTIKNRHFVRERVELDGLDFIDCDFEEVTFVWHMAKPFEITIPKDRVGGLAVLLTDPRLKLYHKLISALEVTADSVAAVDRHGKVYSY